MSILTLPCSYDFVLIPVHLDVHWVLVAINMNKKRISYYDSMNGGKVNRHGGKVLADVKRYLEEEHKDKKQTELPSEWRANDEGLDDDDNELEIPQQGNGSDCGVFTCMYARYIAQRERFHFSQVTQ